MKLEFPNETHKPAYEKLIEQWEKVEKIPTSPYPLFLWNNFEEFLNIIKKNISNSDSPVNSHLFFLCDWGKILWAIEIRHHIDLPDFNEKYWHIWYWIAPEFRKKWYGTKILELWLIEAKKLWILKVMIGCYIDNIWSNKVIEKNWWVFERKTKDWEANRYWVEL